MTEETAEIKENQEVEVTEAEMQQAIDRAANMSIMASREFNRGQRAFFVAIAYLGWFFGDIVFMITTLIIYAMMVARQFFSPARKCLVD